MTKCEKFIEYFDKLTEGQEIPDEVKEFRDMLMSSSYNTTKPTFTETGLEIMKFFQSNEGQYSAKMLSERMLVSSRKISGAMRKLTTDGFVEKFGQNPTIYALSEKGKTADLNIENV